jgi:hypothetical protein
MSPHECLKERLGCLGDAHDLVRGLTVELEIELGLGSAVVPAREAFELGASQRHLRDDSPSDGMLMRGVCGSMPRFFATAGAEVTTPRAARPRAASVLAREDVARISRCDVLAALHRLLRGERERGRSRIADLRLECDGLLFRARSALAPSTPHPG